MVSPRTVYRSSPSLLRNINYFIERKPVGYSGIIVGMIEDVTRASFLVYRQNRERHCGPTIQDHTDCLSRVLKKDLSDLRFGHAHFA